MLKKGLMEKAAVYPILVDHRFDSPLTKMVGDLTSGRIDAAIVWGPLVGLDVKKSNGALILSPLVKDVDKPGFSYRISFGIRHDEPDWKHKLEAVERARAADIGKVLVDYAVPMIDDAGQLIPPADALKGAAVSSDAEPARHGRAKAASSDFKMPGPAPRRDAPNLQDAGSGANQRAAALISGNSGSRPRPERGAGRRRCR